MTPNVLLIVADDLNSWIGALGRHPDVKTPNIDALAARGTLFTHAYCSAPYCNASRMGVFTGCLPSTTGIYHDEPLWDRPDRPITLIERLREAGYYTFGAGKVFHGVFDYATAGREGSPFANWREIENRPSLWDEFQTNEAEPLPDERPLNRLFDFADFDAVPPMYHHFDWGMLPDDRVTEIPDAKVAEAIANFLRNPPKQPFFCAAGLYKPHLPWHVPAQFFELYDVDNVTLPLVKDTDLEDVPPIGREWASSPRDHELVTGRNLWRDAVRGYLAAISYCDHLVGEIIAALDLSGLAEQTTIVFFGDNGFHLGEKLHWRKFTLWEEATRVPLIIVPPESVHRNPRIYQPVSLIDLFPTILELCGLLCPSGMDGASLYPLLHDANPVRREPAVMTWGRGNHSVRTAEWRLIHYGDGSEELYDHRTDPHEWTNLATTAEFEAVLPELRKFLPVERGAPGIKSASDEPRKAGPDFLGIGAQKAGTTWLYENLKRHPAIEFPSDKEIHFWDQHSDKGTEWWINLFSDSEPGRKRGEITPAYGILAQDTVNKIAGVIPDVRLFYSIRNPIERAWSSALMALERAEMTFEEASHIWFIEHFKSTGSRQRGDYMSCLDRWMAAFPGEQFHVVLFDDIVSDPRTVLVGVSRHIGVDPDFFDSIPDSELARPVFAGTGQRLPPKLHDYLCIVYGRSITALEKRLGRELGHWLVPTVEACDPDAGSL